MNILSLRTKLLGSVCTIGDCWEWQRSLTNGGYGQLSFEGTHLSAHVASHLAFRGEIPEGFVVMHSCDNRKCCNPAHLSLGTQSENIKDAIHKGRGFTGTKNGNSKLTDEEVSTIRNSEIPVRILAKTYGVSRTWIYKIKRGESWQRSAAVQPGDTAQD